MPSGQYWPSALPTVWQYLIRLGHTFLFLLLILLLLVHTFLSYYIRLLLFIIIILLLKDSFFFSNFIDSFENICYALIIEVVEQFMTIFYFKNFWHRFVIKK